MEKFNSKSSNPLEFIGSKFQIPKSCLFLVEDKVFIKCQGGAEMLTEKELLSLGEEDFDKETTISEYNEIINFFNDGRMKLKENEKFEEKAKESCDLNNEEFKEPRINWVKRYDMFLTKKQKDILEKKERQDTKLLKKKMNKHMKEAMNRLKKGAGRKGILEYATKCN